MYVNNVASSEHVVVVSVQVMEVVNGDCLVVKTSDGTQRKIFLASIRPPRLVFLSGRVLYVAVKTLFDSIQKQLHSFFLPLRSQKGDLEIVYNLPLHSVLFRCTLGRYAINVMYFI
jgi:hypothetical protein